MPEHDDPDRQEGEGPPARGEAAPEPQSPPLYANLVSVSRLADGRDGRCLTFRMQVAEDAEPVHVVSVVVPEHLYEAWAQQQMIEAQERLAQRTRRFMRPGPGQQN